MIPKAIDAIDKRIPEILEDAENGLPGTRRHLLDRWTANLKAIKRGQLELTDIPGIGPITASAICGVRR